MDIKTQKKRFAFLLLLPALIAVSFLVIYPFIQTIIFSFQSYSLIGIGDKGKFIGLNNYFDVIASSDIFNALKNTLVFNIGSTFLTFLLAFALALLINNNEPFGSGYIRALILIPWAIPVVAVSMVFLWIFNPEYGIINFVFKDLGLITDYKRWVTDPSLAMFTIIITSVWVRFPFMWIMLYTGLQNIPKSLYEAAKIDGANGSQQFIFITLPSIKSIIGVVTLVTIIWNFQMFTLIWIMTKGGPIETTTTFSIKLYKTAFHEFDFGHASALGVIWLIGLLIFSILYSRAFQQD